MAKELALLFEKRFRRSKLNGFGVSNDWTDVNSLTLLRNAVLFEKLGMSHEKRSHYGRKTARSSWEYTHMETSGTWRSLVVS